MNLWTTPLTALGDLDDNCDDLNAFTGKVEWWRKPCDLAAIQIQRRQRGIFSRRRVKHLREMTKGIIDDVLVRMYDLRDYNRNWITTVADAAVEKSLHHAEVASMCLDLIITKTIERSVERQEVAKYCYDYMVDETVERSWRRTYVVKHCMDFLLERTVQAHHYRWRQAIKIQAVVRGKQTRKVGWFHLKRLEMMRKALPKITMWQATIKRNKAQWRISAALEGWRREVCAIAIQAVWRGFCARRAVLFIREMATWPMKIWFDYAMIGTSSVTCSCRIAENERFDPYRYFLEHPGEELENCIQEMEKEVDVVVTSYLTATGYDLLDETVLPEEMPEDVMPDFQHGSIRQAMATLQSIDFDAMRAETALALEQAKAAMEAAEEADREQLEAEEAEFGDAGLGDLPAASPAAAALTQASLGAFDADLPPLPGTPSVVMTEHSY